MSESARVTFRDERGRAVGLEGGALVAAPRTAVFLHPGQVAAFAEPATITTILGSCVAVCLWDADQGRGGMNHYLLPDWAPRGESSARFGNVAIEQLLERLAALGCQPSDLRAKLFGGACVLEAFRARQRHLGQQNVEAARRVLQGSGIAIVAEDTGGDHARKLVFHTDDGRACVRRV